MWLTQAAQPAVRVPSAQLLIPDLHLPCLSAQGTASSVYLTSQYALKGLENSDLLLN